MKTAKKEKSEISVQSVSHGEIEVCIKGVTPLIYNRMSAKAARELLLPKVKTAADKKMNLKHNPFREYRDSVYSNPDSGSDTLLNLPSIMFKKAMSSAAMDCSGAKRAEIGRLTYIPQNHVDLYGVPSLFMTIVRMADISRTPDVRTRALVSEWACRFRIRFLQPILKEQVVVNLLASAGMTRGVGDFRQEKGAGSYGLFEICAEDDIDYLRIVKAGGRKAQEKAMQDANPYDQETTELLSWFVNETSARGFNAEAVS